MFTSTGIAFNFLVFGSQAFMFRRMIAEGDSTRYTALPSLSLLLCMVRDRVCVRHIVWFRSIVVGVGPTFPSCGARIVEHVSCACCVVGILIVGYKPCA